LTLYEGLLHFKSIQNTSIPEHGREITLMSHNLYFKNVNFDAVLSIIAESDPDILAVQELTPKWKTFLDDNIAESYPYTLTIPVNGAQGVGIYSKYKLYNHEIFNNPRTKKPFAHMAEVSIGDKTIQLINVHLASPAVALKDKSQFIGNYNRNYKHRKSQIKKITKRALTNESKYSCQILIGDLNTPSYEPAFKNLKANWSNSFNKSPLNLKYTFPNTTNLIPFLTLDYVLGRGKLEFIETRVIPGGSSDHLAIACRVLI